MKPLTLQEIIDAIAGASERPSPGGSVTRVCIDSRAVEPGDLFFAIAGERFDGHDYIAEAFDRGAIAAVVRDGYALPMVPRRQRKGPVVPADAILIRVDDTVTALGRLARYYRRASIDGSVSVVAVTGSNGKTTTKAMISHILEGRWSGRASIKSFNNEIGVPLTLLSVEPADRFVVCEVGTNAPGEIAALGRLVEPEIAVVTGVSPAHLEGLGTVADIAVEKLSLLTELRPDGCAVLNADCEILRERWQGDPEFRGIKTVTFGQWADADLRLTGVEVGETGIADDGSLKTEMVFTVNDRFRYRLPVPGRHNVMNALAAIGVARRLGMDHDEIAERLSTFALPPMRLEIERIGDLTLINDAYNANPASLAAAIDVLVSMPARRRVMIVGDMRELGAESERLHREAAEAISQGEIDLVIAIGENAKLIVETIEHASEGLVEARAYASVSSAKARLPSYLRPDDTIVMKGSRMIGLERLVPVIRDWVADQGAGEQKRVLSA